MNTDKPSIYELEKECERLGIFKSLALARIARFKGLSSITELEKFSDQELMRYSQIGPKTVANFRASLAELRKTFPPSLSEASSGPADSGGIPPKFSLPAGRISPESAPFSRHAHLRQLPTTQPPKQRRTLEPFFVSSVR